MSKKQTDSWFFESVKRGLLLARDFRLHAHAQRLDPRGVRVAILVLEQMDSHFALKKLSSEEAVNLELYASKIAGEAIKAEEAERLKQQKSESKSRGITYEG